MTAAFSGDIRVVEAIEMSSPILIGGGTFMIFSLFSTGFLWNRKITACGGEKFFHEKGVWFFAVASALLAAIVWFALKINPMMAFGAVIGSTAFFITHGFKQNAEHKEKNC